MRGLSLVGSSIVVAVTWSLQGCGGGDEAAATCTGSQAVPQSSFAQKKGGWVLLESNPSGAKEMTYVQGWKMGDHGTGDAAWFENTKLSMAAGFVTEIGSAVGGPQIQVASAVASQIVSLFQSDFSADKVTDGKEEEFTFKQTFPAGATWQWKMNVNDDCGSCGLDAKVFQSTTSLSDKPCCLPGTFIKSTHPEYGCVVGKQFLCAPGGLQVDTTVGCMTEEAEMIHWDRFVETQFDRGLEHFLTERMKDCRDSVGMDYGCTHVLYWGQYAFEGVDPPEQRVGYMKNCNLVKTDTRGGIFLPIAGMSRKEETALV